MCWSYFYDAFQDQSTDPSTGHALPIHTGLHIEHWGGAMDCMFFAKFLAPVQIFLPTLIALAKIPTVGLASVYAKYQIAIKFVQDFGQSWKQCEYRFGIFPSLD